MTVVLLALAASVSWGVSDFLGGLTSRRLALASVMAITTPIGFVVIGVVVAVHGESPPALSFWLWGLLAGVLGAIGITSLYKGLAVGQMGVVAPIAAAAPLIPIAAGLARGERPSGLQQAGIVLAFLGMLLTSHERVEGSRRARVAKGAAFGVLSAASFGIALVAIDEAANADPYWATLIVRIGTSLTVAIALLVMRSRVRAPRNLWPPLMVLAVLDIGGTLFFSVATTKGYVSVVSAIISVVPVVVALLARVFLHERLQRLQICGAAIAITGVACISAG